MAKLDTKNRISLRKDLIPWKYPSTVEIFYNPIEKAVGVVPSYTDTSKYRVIDKRKVDNQGRLQMTTCILDALCANPTDNFLVFLYEGTIFIKKHDNGTG